MSPSKNRTLLKQSDIKKMTGWNNEQMRKARTLGWVKMERDETGIYYILESLKPEFIIRPINQTA